MSDQDENIFGSNNQNPDTTNQENKEGEGSSNPSDAQQKSEPFADLLGSIRNERGEPKYRSPEDAIKALSHSQEFIPQLQEENKSLRQQLDELRAQMQKFENIQDSLDKLAAKDSNDGVTPKGTIDEQTIAEYVQKVLVERETQTVKQKNISTVASTLKDRFGDKAEEVFYGKAKELGMDANTINSLAATSPQAVLQLFGVSNGTQSQQHSTPKSEINTTGLVPKQDTFVGRNQKSFSAGATTQDYMEEADASRRMVEELHSQGVSVADLSDPKKYAKFFK